MSHVSDLDDWVSAIIGDRNYRRWNTFKWEDDATKIQKSDFSNGQLNFLTLL